MSMLGFMIDILIYIENLPMPVYYILLLVIWIPDITDSWRRDSQ